MFRCKRLNRRRSQFQRRHQILTSKNRQRQNQLLSSILKGGRGPNETKRLYSFIFHFPIYFYLCFYLHSLITRSYSIQALTALFLHLFSYVLKPQALRLTIIEHPQTRGEISYHDIYLF
jgi:hypothetical protein